MFFTIFLLTCSLVFVASPAAQPVEDPILVIEVWTELDPLVATGEERPVPREVAVERLLDDAQRILSGMIYGYSFTYTPVDSARGVAERFELDPVATIPRGDPGLSVFQTWVNRDRLYARIFYTMSAAQMQWRRSWESSSNRRSAAVGLSPFILGPTEKHHAVTDGIRLAVREYVRQRNFNRPQLVAGAVVLVASPALGVRAGNYEANVAIYMQIDVIRAYQHF